jgi:hypothetical protein
VQFTAGPAVKLMLQNLFENWPASVQEGLLKFIAMHHDELPVVAFVQRGDRWLLITTKRLIDCHLGSVREIDCSLLENLDLALFADAAKGAKSKAEIMHLRLLLTDGRQEIIEVEPGQAHLGIWNLLSHFATLNAKKPMG